MKDGRDGRDVKEGKDGKGFEKCFEEFEKVRVGKPNSFDVLLEVMGVTGHHLFVISATCLVLSFLFCCERTVISRFQSIV